MSDRGTENRDIMFSIDWMFCNENTSESLPSFAVLPSPGSFIRVRSPRGHATTALFIIGLGLPHYKVLVSYPFQIEWSEKMHHTDQTIRLDSSHPANSSQQQAQQSAGRGCYVCSSWDAHPSIMMPEMETIPWDPRISQHIIHLMSVSQSGMKHTDLYFYSSHIFIALTF